MDDHVFAVVLTGQTAVWGPFATRPEAQRFADFVTAEVDPAEVRAILSPARELLAWRDMVKEENRG